MLTPQERERALVTASQEVRDKEVLERLDKIIGLLTEIRDNTPPPAKSG